MKKLQPHHMPPTSSATSLTYASTAYNIIIDLGLCRDGSPSAISAENCHIVGACDPQRASIMSDYSPLIFIHIANLTMPTRNNYRRPTRGLS